MKKIFSVIVLIILFVGFSSVFLSFAHAADIRSGDTITITGDEGGLDDLYLFGNNITLDAPVTNDLAAGGRDILIESQVSGNIFAAGGNVRIRGDSDGSVRAAGGNVVIDGNVGRDLLIGGGSVTITKTATVSGDLLVAGGEVVMEGNVEGEAKISGGQVRLNGIIAKSTEINAGEVFIGSKAVIGGDLIYSSPEKATIEKNADIKGEQRYTRIDRQETGKMAGDFFKAFSFYKLFSDILLSVVLIFFLNKFIKTFVGRITSSPFQNFILGLGFLVLAPIISIFLLLLILPGIASFLFYFFVLIFAIYLAKIFAGWFIINWWYKRSKNTYSLDWKAGVVGPIVLFLIGIIPIVGWLFIAILCLISIGAFIQEMTAVVRPQRVAARTNK